MNRNTLSNLSRADVQTLAKRDGLRAVGTTSDIIDRLVQRHEPRPVPYMDSISLATDQETISRKMLRRQGLVPVASASAPRVSELLRVPEDTFEAFVSPLKLPMSDHARTLAERFCDQVRSLFDERDTVSEAVRRLSHDATEVWYELQTSKEDRCAMIIEMEAYHAALYGQFETQAGLVSDLGHLKNEVKARQTLRTEDHATERPLLCALCFTCATRRNPIRQRSRPTAIKRMHPVRLGEAYRKLRAYARQQLGTRIAVADTPRRRLPRWELYQICLVRCKTNVYTSAHDDGSSLS
ncbi:uncharacterized protein TRAVEDRAFT_51048 [Trametes versicolor FP-101664 SS1]|uniref:uncharacterized protein n=1 Tax=Trametes versicolor (strain FP-101664) TaxID=717944 RepID=UPI00046226F2|nr:uncharacterized protein TRAVEDRAFT_51048 [Trametes versicolor FP-101664 SS1]EIW54912.1 hypothetical protein TRAVEDRAFT_51048 [Trametes versicolor FP-101664 SS1]